MVMFWVRLLSREVFLMVGSSITICDLLVYSMCMLVMLVLFNRKEDPSSGWLLLIER